MPGETRVVYDNFSGGEYGHIGGANAPENSFTGRNVMVYRTGLIGPRPGIRLSGVPGASGIIANMWRGIRDGSAADALAWFVTTSGSVRFVGTSYSFFAGTLVGTLIAAKPPQATHLGLAKYALTSITDQTYIVDLDEMGGEGSGDTPLVAISGSPGCSAIATYSSRLFVANDGTEGGFRRVFYTEPGVYTTFPSANYFDVPSKSGVAALVGQRDHLAILMEDGSWWVFRGAGAGASLRKVTSAEWPEWVLNQNCVTNLTDDLIVEFTPIGDWPAVFDGNGMEHLYPAGPRGSGKYISDARDVNVMRLRRPGESVILLPDATNGARSYICRDGIWTIHTLPTNIISAASSVGTGSILLCNNASPHVFYEFDLDIDRPAFTSDTTAQPGDLSDTPVDAHFTLPEWWSKPGTDVRVRQVIVDFVKYNTGSASTNNMTLGVTCFGMVSNDGTESATAQSWSEATSSGSTTGIRDRATFNVGEQGYGAGFQVSLTAIRGVAIKAITVVLDNEPSTPRY